MLKEKYKNLVVPKMKEIFGYKNDLAAPRIIKVVVNTGFGKIISNLESSKKESVTQGILNDLALISSQKPIVTRAKKAVSGFKIRKNSIVGAKVTLRKNRAYNFLERLINIVLPRSRDFRGVSLKNIDKKGNLTIGIKEHIVFPEIQPEKTKVVFGLEVTIVSDAKTREEAIQFFKLMGVPLKEG